MSQQSFSSINDLILRIEGLGIKVIKGGLDIKALEFLDDLRSYLSFPYCVGSYPITSKTLEAAYLHASGFVYQLKTRGVFPSTTYIYIDDREDSQQSFRLMAEFQHIYPGRSKDVKVMMLGMMNQLLSDMGHELVNENIISDWRIYNYYFLHKGLHKFFRINYPSVYEQPEAVKKLAIDTYSRLNHDKEQAHASHVSGRQTVPFFKYLELSYNGYTGDRIVDRRGTDRLLFLLPVPRDSVEHLRKFFESYGVDHRIKYMNLCYFPRISIDSYIKLRLGAEEYKKINSVHDIYEYLRENGFDMMHPIISSFSPNMIARTCNIGQKEAYTLFLLLKGYRPIMADGKPLREYKPMVEKENSLTIDEALHDLKRLLFLKKHDINPVCSSTPERHEIIDGLIPMSPLNSLPKCFFEDKEAAGARSGLDRLITFEPIDARNMSLIKEILGPDHKFQGEPKVFFREIAPGVLCPAMRLCNYLSQRFEIQPEKMNISQLRRFLNRKSVRQDIELPSFESLYGLLEKKLPDITVHKMLRIALNHFSGSFCADKKIDDIRTEIRNLNRQQLDSLLINDFGLDLSKELPIGI